MNYDSFFEYIDKQKVKLAFEFGSRDGKDAVDISNYFDCNVVAFECNPDTIQLCRDNISGYDKITLVESAVSDSDSNIDFYKFNLSKHNNPGASSALKINWEEDVQDKITVPSTRLDTYCVKNGIDKVDLLCMDLQETEIVALNGFGEFLYKTKYVISEACFNPTYIGGNDYYELETYLNDFGFEYVRSTVHRDARPQKDSNAYGFFDVLFINNKIS